MNCNNTSTRFFVTAFLAIGLSATVHGQATRTWVSGVGDDVNPCSRTAPCKTFAGAISKTAAGGEINALDPGGFGAVTINKSLAIVCDHTEGGALAGGNGITINAAATDKVYLSGLDVKGVNPPNIGIRVLSAAQVTVKNCSVRDFVNGIVVDPVSGTTKVDIIDSVIANNSGTGVLVRPTGSGNVRMDVNGSKMLNNSGDGLMGNGTATTGTINIAVRNSESAHNTADGFVAFSTGASSQMMIDASAATNNNRGINSSGAGAIIRFARSTVTGNAIGVNQVGAGSALSYSPASNCVDGNGADGSFGTTPSK
jgi:hypothetical protein